MKHIGALVTFAALGSIFLLALLYLYVGWSLPTGEQGSHISPHGYVAIALGVIATFALGIGLMSLVFYSNRNKRD